VAVDVSSKTGHHSSGQHSSGQHSSGQYSNDPDDAGHLRALGLSTGWAVFSYLIAGMMAYGAIGWLISRATHLAILFPVGMLLGLGISLAFVIHRYGRAEAQAAGTKARTSGEGRNLRNGTDR
jgi:F0F1-type ATP synthase assembly protein I